MAWRIKRLKQTGAGEGEAVNGYGAGLVISSMVSEAGRVFDVNAQELEVEEDALFHLLETGQLASTDLVHFDGGWVALTDAIPLAERVAPFAAAEARVRFLKGALAIFSVIALIAAWFVIRMRS